MYKVEDQGHIYLGVPWPDPLAGWEHQSPRLYATLPRLPLPWKIYSTESLPVNPALTCPCPLSLRDLKPILKTAQKQFTLHSPPPAQGRADDS